METSGKVERLSFFPAEPIVRSNTPKIDWYRDVFKRVFDLLFALILFPIVFPLILILMVLVKIDSKGPAIYRSLRIGRNGKKFNCLKLRTMHLNAEEKLEDLLREREELRQEYEKYCKLKKDPRVTRVGRFLRATSLDEIPQLFNIFSGEMSFVGPRPAFEKEIEKYYGPNSSKYLKVRPGITGLWQVNGRNDTSFENRVALDCDYSQRVSLSQDLAIIIKTIPTALSTKGAY